MPMYRFSYRTRGMYRLKDLHVPAENAADATRMFLLAVGPGKRQPHPDGDVIVSRYRAGAPHVHVGTIPYSEVRANPDAMPGRFQKMEWQKDNEAAPKVQTNDE